MDDLKSSTSSGFFDKYSLPHDVGVRIVAKDEDDNYVICDTALMVIDAGCGDYNGDDIVDMQDLLDKRDDIVAGLISWIQNCLLPQAPCGDYNGDGVVDVRDFTEKRQEVITEFVTWIEQCWLPAVGNPDAKEALEEVVLSLERKLDRFLPRS